MKIYAEHVVVITIDGREYSLTNGVLDLPAVQGIQLDAGSTNQWTLNGGYGYALVDAQGRIQDWTVSEMDLALMVIEGFGFGIVVVGIPYAVLWTIRRVLSAGRLSAAGSGD